MDVGGSKKFRVSGWGLLKGVWKATDLGVEGGGVVVVLRALLTHKALIPL